MESRSGINFVNISAIAKQSCGSPSFGKGINSSGFMGLHFLIVTSGYVSNYEYAKICA